MNDRRLEREVDTAKCVFDDLITEIERLESELDEANDTIDKLEDRIDDLLSN